MGILKGGATILESEETYVYSEDADVSDTLPDALKGSGWIRLALAPDIGRDADIVKCRALDPEERNASRNIGSKGQAADAASYIASRATLEIKTTDATGKRVKITKRAEIREWWRAVAQRNWPALDLLSQVVTSMTLGDDPDKCHAIARRLLGYEEPAPPETAAEEGADDGASKSGDGAA